MFRKWGFRLFLLLFLLGVFSCSTSTKNEDIVAQPTPPALPLSVVMEIPTNAPDKISTPTDVVNEFLIQYQAYYQILKNTAPRFKGTFWLWTLHVQGITVRIIAIPQEDKSVTWQVFWNGSDGNNLYEDWLAMQGVTMDDGRHTEWTIFTTNSDEVAAEYNWDVDHSENIFLTYTSGDLKIDMVNNTNKSGSLKRYVQTLLNLESGWNENGSGWWKEYDNDGNLSAEGTWN